MSKIIKTYDEARQKIARAVSLASDPVIQTLSPRGGNVLFEDSHGNINVTNDGVTIAKQIESDDPIEDKVIELIKFAALRTNTEAGDGTTTATLLTKVIVTEGMRLLDNGMSRLELKQHLESMSSYLTALLTRKKIEVTDSEQLKQIARISSNNDDDIAENVLEVIEAAGQDGLVLIEAHHKPETKVIIEPGFLLKQPLAFPELVQNRGFSAVLEDVPVLITDKRLYYEQEAETILRTALEAGYKKLVVVAADFIGKTPNFFLANHDAGAIELILIKEPDSESLHDLATYLGGRVFTEKSGSIVDKISAEDFVRGAKVFADRGRSIFTSSSPENTAVKERIRNLRDEIEGTDESDELEKRLAALTNGTVTIKVGGHTPVETQERIFRYEDAVSATRAAQKDGYVVGGGLTLLHLFNEHEWGPDIAPTVRRFCEASVRQIAENSGKHADSVVEKIADMPQSDGYGYNAKTDTFENLLDAGVIDPYRVTEMSIQNSISVAIALLTSGYFIVNDNQEKDGGQE